MAEKFNTTEMVKKLGVSPAVLKRMASEGSEIRMWKDGSRLCYEFVPKSPSQQRSLFDMTPWPKLHEVPDYFKYSSNAIDRLIRSGSVVYIKTSYQSGGAIVVSDKQAKQQIKKFQTAINRIARATGVKYGFEKQGRSRGAVSQFKFVIKAAV